VFGKKIIAKKSFKSELQCFFQFGNFFQFVIFGSLLQIPGKKNDPGIVPELAWKSS